MRIVVASSQFDFTNITASRGEADIRQEHIPRRVITEKLRKLLTLDKATLRLKEMWKQDPSF
jgi:hypothetical protein